MNHADMHDEAHVRELLSVAVSDVQRPPGESDGQLISRARRIRRNRRARGAAALSLTAVAAVVCAVTVTRSDIGTGSTPPGNVPATPARSATAPSAASPTDRVRVLLPPGVGALTKVSTPMEHVGRTTRPEPRSPLNGRYTVRKSGTAGYLEVDILDPAHDGMPDPSAAVLRGTDMCFPQPAGSFRKPNYGCTKQNLADGSQLKTWVTPPAAGTGVAYEAQLVLPDGRKAGLIACSGNPAYGPLMPAPPLTRAQLASLVRQPGWFTG
jgi:hypothetical protein